jgi:hypothetical protein
VADFRLRDKPTLQPLRFPTPWPARRVLGGSVILALHTTATPDFVTVKSWRHLVAGGGRQPEPVLAAPPFQCNRFSAPQCALRRHDGELLLTLPARALAGEYVAVFCDWHIPLAQEQTGAHASTDASATWLFDVVHLPNAGASAS